MTWNEGASRPPAGGAEFERQPGILGRVGVARDQALQAGQIQTGAVDVAGVGTVDVLPIGQLRRHLGRRPGGDQHRAGKERLDVFERKPAGTDGPDREPGLRLRQLIVQDLGQLVDVVPIEADQIARHPGVVIDLEHKCRQRQPGLMGAGADRKERDGNHQRLAVEDGRVTDGLAGQRVDPGGILRSDDGWRRCGSDLRRSRVTCRGLGPGREDRFQRQLHHHRRSVGDRDLREGRHLHGPDAARQHPPGGQQPRRHAPSPPQSTPPHAPPPAQLQSRPSVGGRRVRANPYFRLTPRRAGQ